MSFCCAPLSITNKQNPRQQEALFLTQENSSASQFLTKKVTFCGWLVGSLWSSTLYVPVFVPLMMFSIYIYIYTDIYIYITWILLFCCFPPLGKIRLPFKLRNSSKSPPRENNCNKSVTSYEAECIDDYCTFPVKWTAISNTNKLLILHSNAHRLLWKGNLETLLWFSNIFKSNDSSFITSPIWLYVLTRAVLVVIITQIICVFAVPSLLNR